VRLKKLHIRQKKPNRQRRLPKKSTPESTVKVKKVVVADTPTIIKKTFEKSNFNPTPIYSTKRTTHKNKIKKIKHFRN
jgi:hypothetical protein